MSDSELRARPRTASDPRPSLVARLAPGQSAEQILDRFLDWVSESGLTPYPQQEEALLELMLGRHVVLGTPTGSGKSLVAEGLLFRGLCEGRRCFYTSPVKALASEKFFAFCEDFGAENVGMLTGDASINAEAPVVCCTTEVLANMALRQGEQLDAPYVVLDEFHYYADRDRGVAWQVPLLALPATQFLLMSATLGNTAVIEEHLARRTGRPVSHVSSDERPVPLEYEYRETPLHETLEDLVRTDQAPVYVVSFTQRECGERAQALTSAKLATRDERRRVAEAVAGVRFDSAYGKDLRRFLRHGVAVHHAGLLPRYRLLVEQLAQRGSLKVICGTDTLGVGVNIPIRTVVFTSLCKYDGEKVALLGPREFKQIAGRAGRKGFDDRGRVVCQAPEHVIEGRRAAARAAARGRKRARKRPPPGQLVWNRDTFERLVARPPEMLESRFRLTHGMLLELLQRPGAPPARGGGYRAAIGLIGHSHESERARARLRRRAAALFRSLRAAGVVEVARGAGGRGATVRVGEALQEDFSLHQTLSLYLFEALPALDPDEPAYALDVLSLVESILEDPQAILVEQVRRGRRELLARLKAEGVPYEERQRQLEEVTHPQPLSEFIEASFRLFAERHPWVGDEDIRPKSIAREMLEDCRGFVDYAREVRIARSEGLLLRYLSQVHNTLVKSVPLAARTDELYDAIAFFRAELQRVDASLVEAWERLLAPVVGPAVPAPAAPVFDLARQEKLLAARVRAELNQLVRALSRREFEEAASGLRREPGDAWEAEDLERALAPFFEAHGEIDFGPEARRAHRTLMKRTGPRSWDVFQTLLDREGGDLWAIEGEVDLRDARDPEGPLVRLRRIGS